jgi:transcription antitermination factor NusA-like protein
LSQTTEFEVSRDYIGRVVGTGGAGVNKLRDQLGVKIDLVDETDDKEKDAKKKKSSTPSAQKVAVKVSYRRSISLLLSFAQISGRRENAEEAKRRILALVDRLVCRLS